MMDVDPNDVRDQLVRKLIRLWRDQDPDIWEGVDEDLVFVELTRAWTNGGIDGLAAAMEVEVRDVENLLWS